MVDRNKSAEWIQKMLSKDKLKWDEVKESLYKWATNQNVSKQVEEKSSGKDKVRRVTSKEESGKFNGKCDQCGMYGHKKADCIMHKVNSHINEECREQKRTRS